jgi:hypothetical protein
MDMFSIVMSFGCVDSVRVVASTKVLWSYLFWFRRTYSVVSYICSSI